MKVLVSTFSVFCLMSFTVAFNLSADNHDEPKKDEAKAEEAKPMESESMDESFGYDNLIISSWHELGMGKDGQTNGYNYLLIRPSFKFSDGSKFHLGIEIENGSGASDGISSSASKEEQEEMLANVSYKEVTDSLMSEYVVGDPYLMYSRSLYESGMFGLSGYLRYYIPISPSSRSATRYSYFRASVNANVATTAGINVGVTNELRHYAHSNNINSDGKGRIEFRYTPYLALSGKLGPFPFYSSHGAALYTYHAGRSSHWSAYNETVIYTDIKNTPFKLGLGIIESRPLGKEDTRFFWDPKHSNYVIELVSSF